MIKNKHSFAPRSLIFKLQQEVVKFIDICLSWSSAKTDLLTCFSVNFAKFLRTLFLQKTSGQLLLNCGDAIVLARTFVVIEIA